MCRTTVQSYLEYWNSNGLGREIQVEDLPNDLAFPLNEKLDFERVWQMLPLKNRGNALMKKVWLLAKNVNVNFNELEVTNEY